MIDNVEFDWPIEVKGADVDKLTKLVPQNLQGLEGFDKTAGQRVLAEFVRRATVVKDFAEEARRNVLRYEGETPNWEIRVRDATAGLATRIRVFVIGAGVHHDHRAARFNHPGDLLHRDERVRIMLQHLQAQHQVEAAVDEWQRLGRRCGKRHRQ